MPYQLTDELFLWWLADTRQPALIGTLRFVRSLAGVSLQYAESWLRGGFALSEDLPLTPNEHFPSVRETAAGAVDDARPDRWGERVIRFVEKPPRLSVLEYLYFAGDRRFGALGVSTSAEAYQPHSRDHCRSWRSSKTFTRSSEGSRPTNLCRRPNAGSSRLEPRWAVRARRQWSRWTARNTCSSSQSTARRPTHRSLSMPR